MPARKTAPVRVMDVPMNEAPTVSQFAPLPAPLRAKRKHMPAWVRILPVALIIAGFAGAYYFHAQYSALARNPNAVTEKEVQSIVAKVGKLMVLPDEAPTVATVSDAEKLRDQAFFKNAENGDKLLAFPKAQQAVLYRPSQNKLIAVAPIVLGAK